jgi:hypothetical protein
MKDEKKSRKLGLFTKIGILLTVLGSLVYIINKKK